MQIFTHWTNPNEEWKTLNVNERDADGNVRLAGPSGEEKAVQYSALMHKETNEVYQYNTTLDTLWKVAAASLLYVPQAIVSTAAVAGIGITHGIQEARSAWRNGLEQTWATMPSRKEIQPYAVSELKKGIFLGTVFLFCTTNYAGLMLKIALVAPWYIYTAYNPREAARLINKADQFFNIKPKAECKTLANDWTLEKDWKDVAKGAIPLSAAFGFSEVGNIGDKVKGENRFENVKTEEEKKTQ